MSAERDLGLVDRLGALYSAVVSDTLDRLGVRGQILAPRIDGDAALGCHYIDQLTRTTERRHFIDNHRNAIAEGRHSQDRAP